MAQIDFTKRMTKNNIITFTNYIKNLSKKIGFKVSSRGWCYIMEGKGFINKNQFDKVENWINKCRKQGYLPIDFTEEDSARMFSGVETMHTIPYDNYIKDKIDDLNYISRWYHPNYWEGEDYYIQMIVEKVDLVTLSKSVLEDYHIPIANARGWSSMLQRAKYAKRFRIAESLGMKCVLLYFGDHDPDGLRIADNIMKNLHDLEKIMWSNGTPGYNPRNLKIDRIGLTHAFIKKHKLTWIDNLITGGRKNGKPLNLASPSHRNHKLPYVQNYLKKIGNRKCEANACVIIPEITRDYIRTRIEKYLGEDAIDRFRQKKIDAQNEIQDLLDEKDFSSKINDMIEIFE